jgi:hypothetical protein
MLTDWDTRIEPGELNDWLNLHHGYVKGNRFVWSSVRTLGASVKGYVACVKTPAPMQRFASALEVGRVVLVMVDWEPGGEVETHWVRLLRVMPGETAIMDPWQPTPELAITTLEKHYCLGGWDAALAILRATIYERTAAIGRDPDGDRVVGLSDGLEGA